MRKTEVLGFRVEPQHETKIQQIRRQTGWKTSVILRKLVEAAEIEPAKITVNLSTNANDDITRQGKNVVVAA